MASAAAALAVLAVPLFYGLGRTDLDGDESIYAGVVERMVAGGSWLTPAEENGPFLEKPPLRFWLVAAPMKIGLLPAGETGHRLVDALLGAGTLVYVFLIARRLGGTASGLGAAFLVITQTQMLFVHGLRSGTMEPLLVLSYCGAIHHFLRWTDGAGRRDALAVAAWCAAAVLAKTVAAVPLLVVLATATLLITPWRARAVADGRTWGRAAALFAAIAAPWFLLQLALQGTAVWQSMFLEHVVTRVTASVDPTHLEPWSYYPVFVAGTLKMTWPWVAAGAVALCWRPRSRQAGVLLALWLVIPVVLFSMAASKLAHYVYPALPALAVIGGQAFGAAVVLVGDVRRRAPLARGAGIALAVFVAAALTLAAVVAVQGRVSVTAGPVDLRTANPARPLIAATAGALVLCGRRRAALAVLGVALVASEVGREYGRALEHAAIRNRPLGAFVACVAAQSGGEERRIRVSVGRPLSRDERYYFGRVGWRESAELDPGHVSRRVRDAERDTPLVLDYPRYRALLPSMADWPAPVLQSLSQAPLRGHDLLVLLPGRFRPCALATGGAS